MNADGIVYLIHMDQPIRGKRHYLGFTTDVAKREKEHGTARGSRLLRQAREAGIGFRVVRTWVGGTDLERQLKKRANSAQLCPVCKAEKDEQ